jgi:hypothetical protein
MSYIVIRDTVLPESSLPDTGQEKMMTGYQIITGYRIITRYSHTI